MLQARRVGAAGDKAADLAARLDQLVSTDVLVDPLSQRGRVHRPIVTEAQRSSICGSQPRDASAG